MTRNAIKISHLEAPCSSLPPQEKEYIIFRKHATLRHTHARVFLLRKYAAPQVRLGGAVTSSEIF
jgi:hypothetical protein